MQRAPTNRAGQAIGLWFAGHGQPHAHVPEVHQRPDGSLDSTRRATDVTTAGDIDYADDALRKGEPCKCATQCVLAALAIMHDR